MLPTPNYIVELDKTTITNKSYKLMPCISLALIFFKLIIAVKLLIIALNILMSNINNIF